MEISTMGHANTSAATKRHTDMVLPNRRGVEILARGVVPKIIRMFTGESKARTKDAVTSVNAQDFLVNALPCVHLE